MDDEFRYEFDAYYNKYQNEVMIYKRGTSQLLFVYLWSEDGTPCTLSDVELYYYTLKHHQGKFYQEPVVSLIA